MNLFGHKEIREKHVVRLSDARIARAVSASFDAAQTTKDNWKHWSVADACSADAEANPAVRQTLRRRSRYEVTNNSYAKGLVQMLANDTIGTGPRLQMLTDDDAFNEECESAFREWASVNRLAQKLRLMRIARCQDGESFAVIGYNPKSQCEEKMRIEVIEADRIQGDQIVDEESGDSTVDGITFDKYGIPIAYRLLKCHPGDDRVTIVAGDYMTVPVEFMIHTFVESRPGLHRGIPELTSALPLFAQLRRYNLATLAAAEAAADFAAILYTDSPPDGETDAVEPLDSIQLERNMMMTMPAGWKMAQLDPKQPTANHGEFVKGILAEIARCVCATYGTISGDFSGFNYASGRLDNQIYQKSILVDRAKWENEVLDPMLRMWLREYCLVRGVEMPRGAIHEWFWDGFMHVDPTKEANAQAIRLGSMTTTLADEYAKEGKDYQKKLRQIAKERRMMEELGISAVPQDSGTQDDEPQEKDEEDNNEKQ